MSTQVQVDALTKDFIAQKGISTSILKGVSLTAPAGKITTILGESGCGKTTLLRIVAGLESATTGRILIGDRDVTNVPASQRKVAMVFQNYGLYPAKTVSQNIEFPLKMSKVPAKERKVRAEEVARILHMEHVLDRLPAQLSGGQRQRVGICRALARNPEILLMDEPLSNLDAQLRIEMRSELVSLQRRIGSTMMYVTHDQVEAMTMSDLIVVMRGGHIEQMGSPQAIFENPGTTYVASFLGNMNIAPGLPNSGIVNGPGSNGALGEQLVGVRPEHLHLNDGRQDVVPGSLIVEGDVFMTELLGTDRVLHVRAGSQVWRARIDANIPFSERVSLTAQPQNIHMFESASGKKHVA